MSLSKFTDELRALPMARHYFFLPQIAALLIIAPIAWMAFDRTPPLKLYDGTITPHVVQRGQENVEVKWRAKFSGADCPGFTQRELIDSKRSLWPQRARARRGIFVPDAPGSLTGTVVTPPLSIPEMASGPASYRVTQFYYCNWLQMAVGWPIVEVSPDINFEVAP